MSGAPGSSDGPAERPGCGAAEAAAGRAAEPGAGAAPRSAEASLAALEAVLRPLDSACVAFSGGVDSSVVVAVAARVTGPRAVVAVTASSPTYLADELAAARAVARSLGVRHVVVETDEADDESFASNPPDRCYYCKGHLAEALAAVAEREGCAVLFDGANADDLGDQRPGMRATAERGVRHPLLEAGLGKADVRAVALHLGLPTWDRPQNACLASRIPYGVRITPEALERVAAAEAALRELGFVQCRVRYHGPVARVEVEVEQVERAAGECRAEIVRRVRAAGFTYVALDLEGFRSGSMNEVLTPDG